MLTNHVVLSGGLDSTATLTLAQQTGHPTTAWTITYGQTHQHRETAAADTVAATVGVELRTLDLTGLVTGSALLGDGPIPRADYDRDNMGQTVVHGRNMLFASVVVAQARPGDRVWLGVHGGDHDLYPDCRPEFWEPFTLAVQTAYQVGVVTPLLGHDKSFGVRVLADAGVDPSITYSCYEGGLVHCGQCGTCRERRRAFLDAGVKDLTVYRS